MPGDLKDSNSILTSYFSASFVGNGQINLQAGFSTTGKANLGVLFVAFKEFGEVSLFLLPVETWFEVGFDTLTLSCELSLLTAGYPEPRLAPEKVDILCMML